MRCKPRRSISGETPTALTEMPASRARRTASTASSKPFWGSGSAQVSGTPSVSSSTYRAGPLSADARVETARSMASAVGVSPPAKGFSTAL
jgi:hypothetical protein